MFEVLTGNTREISIKEGKLCTDITVLGLACVFWGRVAVTHIMRV